MRIESRTVSGAAVTAFRLARHHLGIPAPRSRLVDVVSNMMGVQAQVGSAARLALRARVKGLTPEDVDRALWKDRSLVKTWCMRGTTHLVPASELAVYVRGLASRVARSSRWMARRGLSPEAVDRLVAAIERALEAGPLRRKGLAARVAADTDPSLRRWVEHSWGGVTAVACMRGTACFGPDRGNEVTFARVDRWVPGWRDLPQHEAEKELARGYLRAFGPATIHDLARWADFAISDARSIWERIAADRVEVGAHGGPAWLLREDAGALRRARFASPVVRLLPTFDTFLLGHRDKGHLVDAAHYTRVYRKAGWISATVLVDGRVSGVWSLVRRGSRLRIRVEPFSVLSRPIRDGIEAEAQDIGRFLGAGADVSYARR